MFSEQLGLIIACDVDSLDSLRALVAVSHHRSKVVGYKVGCSLALRYGLPATVAAIRGTSDLPIIYDHQKAATDIPQMGGPFARACNESGVQSVIFFPHSGPKTLGAFIDGALENSLVPIVGLAMTHPQYFQSEGGFIVDNAADLICSMALQSGVEHFVLPGTKTDIVQRFARGPLAVSAMDVSIMMPGIGAQGGSLDAAFRAAEPHRRYAIIGSAIYASPDPAAALDSIEAAIPQ